MNLSYSFINKKSFELISFVRECNFSSIPFFCDIFDSDVKSGNDSFLKFKNVFEANIVVDDFNKSREVKYVGFDGNKDHDWEEVIHTAEFDFSF